MPTIYRMPNLLSGFRGAPGFRRSHFQKHKPPKSPSDTTAVSNLNISYNRHRDTLKVDSIHKLCYVSALTTPFWAIDSAASLRRFTARDMIHVLTNTGKTFTWRCSPDFGQHWHSIRHHVAWGTNTQLAYTDHSRRRCRSIWDKRGWHPWHCIRSHVTRGTNTQLAFTVRQTVQLWRNVVG